MTEEGIDARCNFYTVTDELEFCPLNKELIARDIPAEYNRLSRQTLPNKKCLLVYYTRPDIKDLCHHESLRIERMTGRKRVINPDDIELMFAWRGGFHLVPKVPYSVERWKRFFTHDTNGPCVICMNESQSVTVCSNCFAVICLECYEKVGTEKCQVCKIETVGYDDEYESD